LTQQLQKLFRETRFGDPGPWIRHRFGKLDAPGDVSELAAVPLPGCPTQVAGDGEDPSPDALLAAELAHTLKDARQGLLYQVLGVFSGKRM
jgi:hypothetical protein